MARMIGEAGGHQVATVARRFQKTVIGLFLFGVCYAFVCGHVAAGGNPYAVLVFVVVALPLLWKVKKTCEATLVQMDLDRRGARGEIRVGEYLQDLPDTYVVFNDVGFAESFGNIDHLVIGPTGMLAIDVKNWRGVVAADGKGELLHNGKPTDKPQVRGFTRRVMDLKKRIKALSRLDPYVQAVFAFPHTRVEAAWGTTGAVHCVRMEHLEEYITQKSNRSLPSGEIDKLTKCVEMLVSME